MQHSVARKTSHRLHSPTITTLWCGVSYNLTHLRQIRVWKKGTVVLKYICRNYCNMSVVSDTDLKLFVGLANPEKTNADAANEEDEDEYDDEDEDEDDDGEEDDDDDEQETYADEKDGMPDLTSLHEPVASNLGGSAISGANSGVASAGKDVEGVSESMMTPEEVDYAKTSVMLELERLRSMGCKLTKEYTIEDPLETLEYEARRHVLMLEEKNSINMMKDGLKLFVGGCEFANDKFGPFLNLSGFSQSISSELTVGKHDMTLSRLHRKYFRTSTQSSPEMELAMALLGSAAMHHFQRTYINKVMPTRGGQAAHIPNVPQGADDDSDEDLPPGFQ